MTRDPLMPEVLDGFDRALRRNRPRRRWFAPRALGITLVGLAIGGTAIAGVAPWNPMGSSSEAATTTPPPPDQLRTLSVLRRPQTDRDRGPLITAFLERYDRHAFGNDAKIRLPFVRFLREVETKAGAVDAGSADTGQLGRASLFLVPQTTPSRSVAPGEVPGPQSPDPLQVCLNAIYDYWPDPTSPPPGLVAEARGAHVQAPERPQSLADRISGGGTCGSAHVVRMKGLSSGGAFGGNVYGIVPDGVATIRARTRDGQVVEAKVTDNSFQLLAPGRNLPPDPHDRDTRPWAPPLSGQFKSGSYEWLDASGTVIRKMPY